MKKFTKTPLALLANTVLLPTEKIVLTALIYFSRDKGICYPSITTLQQTTGLARSTVIKALKQLEYYGIIMVAQRGKAKQTNNLYRIFVEDEIFEQDTPEKMIEVAGKYNWFRAKKELVPSRQTKTQAQIQ